MASDDFARLYGEHANDLLGFLVYRTGDRALAEDILADTFERVLRTKKGWRNRGASQKTWLYSIALNRLRDLARRADAEVRAYERVGVPSGFTSDFDVLEDRDAIARALANLPEDEREAVALRYGAGLSLSEVAEASGVPQTTAEGRIYRGLRRLREIL